MPEWFTNLGNRLDHLLCAMLPGKIDKLNITDGLRLSIKQNRSNEGSVLSVNRVSMKLPVNLPIFWNYQNQDQWSVSYGLSSKIFILSTRL